MSSESIDEYHIGSVRLHVEADGGLHRAPRKPGSRLLRTLRLLEFLQSGRICNSAELAEFCGVSRRTVFRDIATLQEAGIAVIYDEARGGYFIPHRLALAPSELTFAEAAALQIACCSASAILGLNDAVAAAAKVGAHLPKSLRDAAKALADNVIAQTEGHAGNGDVTHFAICLEALHRRRRLKFVDHDSATVDTVDAYRLLFAEGAWRMVGKSLLHSEVRCYSLSNMRNLALLDESYLIPLRFSLDRYLGNAWRISRELPARQIVILFDTEVADDVSEICWHKTQQTTQLPDGRLEFRAEVDGLDEIVSWILKFGPHAEVLEPPELRTRINETAEAMHRKYAADAGST